MRTRKTDFASEVSVSLTEMFLTERREDFSREGLEGMEKRVREKKGILDHMSMKR
jgi:hypothetical protein